MTRARPKLTAKQRVISKWPSAWFNSKARTIEGYSQGLILGVGSINAKSIENSAWAAAARKLK